MRAPYVLLSSALVLLPFAAAAKKAPVYAIDLMPPAVPASSYSKTMRAVSGRSQPLALYAVGAAVNPGTPEAMARQFLREHTALLGLRSADLSDLVHHSTRSGRAGHNVRFEQTTLGVPVHGSRTVIHISPNNTVTQVANGYRPQAVLSSAAPLVSAAQARTTVLERLQVQGALSLDETSLVAYPEATAARLAWQVRVAAQKPLGDWEALVDAATGEVFVLWDLAAYAPATVSMFDPDPLSSSRTPYGSPISDAGDADSAALQAQVVTGNLADIEFAGGKYYLNNAWAELIDHETPSTGFWEQASPDFRFNREQNGFEAGMTFWHIDHSMRYMNETLGIPVRPYQYDGGVQFDPHGLDGEDNSHYSPGAGQLAFGEGCVDDNEDADVIWHELGHGIHDWVTAGGLSNMVDGLSEGFGDYWAQSYSRSLGQWQPTDEAYHWVYNWDGHNECWAGRVTNIDTPYPSAVQPYPLVHSGGQHWATCLMRIWDRVGREKTDAATLEGLAMTNQVSSQIDAANAVYQAAQDLGYSTEEVAVFEEEFSNCGYVLGLPSVIPPSNNPPASDPTPPTKPTTSAPGSGTADKAKFGSGAMPGMLALFGLMGLRRRKG